MAFSYGRAMKVHVMYNLALSQHSDVQRLDGLSFTVHKTKLPIDGPFSFVKIQPWLVVSCQKWGKSCTWLTAATKGVSNSSAMIVQYGCYHNLIVLMELCIIWFNVHYSWLLNVYMMIVRLIKPWGWVFNTLFQPAKYWIYIYIYW